MQYVGRAIGSVSKTWNSINPATLSGAIDVIVVEQENGDLCCSPFHVRFGKFSLLRPSQKKVDFSVNGSKVDLPMKLGEGGEAFFVFETATRVPKDLLTSPIVSPVSSASSSPGTPITTGSGLQEPEFLDLSRSRPESPTRELDDHNDFSSLDPKRSSWSSSSPTLIRTDTPTLSVSKELTVERAQQLTRKLTDINIPSKINDNGDIILDMTGYKAEAEDIKHSEEAVKKILAEELGIGSDLESMIGSDEAGNVRIFSRDDAMGYASDDNRTSKLSFSSGSDDTSSVVSSPELADDDSESSYHVKTLRLTSDQLKSLSLHKGANDISFSVNQGKAVCAARMFYWTFDVPIVISDIDGTITKSDALGHVLTMLGRDWTHLGVSKLFTDIANNGYNIMYLTARSVGQADSTRYYLRGIDQNGYKLPDGPVILSPDRTIAALRREVIMRKPEIFKMACLRDIQSLYGEQVKTPFYAGFGNRITDALSYRSVGVPSSRIFTINTNSDVHMELLEMAGYKSSYIHIADLVDHFFPPIIEAALGQVESFTDVTFWRETLPELSDEEEEEAAVPASKSPVAMERRSVSPVKRLLGSSTVATSEPSSEKRPELPQDNERDEEGEEEEEVDKEYTNEFDDEEEYDNDEYDDEVEYEEDEFDDEDIDEEADLDADLLAGQENSVKKSSGETPEIIKASETLAKIQLKS